jgi:hypothetical protein
MNACEYLSRVGFDALLGAATPPTEEDDPEAVEVARRADHRRVCDRLLSLPAKALVGREGVSWLGQITWVDRVPGLKTWAGQVTLPKLITKLQDAVCKHSPADLFEFRCPMKGASGIDALSCQNAIDIGFSPNALDMPVVQRPAMELLAIYGLETLPLLSFANRVCGFVHDGRLWRFRVEDRDGGYYHRWGTVESLESDE